MTSNASQPLSQDALAAASRLRIALLVTTWYGELTDALAGAAIQTLVARGVEADHISRIDVPGAFELPQAAAWIARAGDADAIVALGCIVRGETPHFEYVARAATDGLGRVAVDTGIPVGFGVITADTIEQAQARSGPTSGKGGNKGVEAADAALRMALIYRTLEQRRSTPRGGLR